MDKSGAPTCDCVNNGTDGGIINDVDVYTELWDVSFFQLQPGLCGTRSTLDFYVDPETYNATYYIHNGNGALLGTCQNNTAGGLCQCEGETCKTNLAVYWNSFYICSGTNIC